MSLMLDLLLILIVPKVRRVAVWGARRVSIGRTTAVGPVFYRRREEKVNQRPVFRLLGVITSSLHVGMGVGGGRERGRSRREVVEVVTTALRVLAVGMRRRRVLIALHLRL